jgi:phospholipid/cholesterol/gamma-HCH transport system substrate-binding protein
MGGWRMMKIRFNKFERVAGLFVLIAIFGGLAFMLSVAIKQGWFDAKSYYQTTFESADGIHPGTNVQMAGLKAGSVEEVELLGNNKILVKFYVLSKFQHKIRQDSVSQLVRPFIIGDRVLDISVGSEESPLLAENAMMPSHEGIDLMTLMSGKKLGNSLETMSSMLNNVKILAEAFLSKDRTQTYIQMMDRIDPLLKNLNTMSLEVIKLSKQATKDENLGVVLSGLAVTTRELNSLLPELTQKAPAMAKNVEALVNNLAELTEQFKVFIPALAAVGPDLPRASKRALEALDEAVVLMKAMQKSMLVRGNVREVREEESKARQPAEQ